jgi:signal transduction histidine kinase
MQHTLEVALPESLPLVRVDAERIGQVFNNLVSNATKYAPAGSCIRLSAAQSGDMLRVSVSDEGPGISAEDRPHVFEAFRRGDDGRTRRTKGAGLGLAICKGIVESHGGSIWIEDRPGPGATITFTLSIAK